MSVKEWIGGEIKNGGEFHRQYNEFTTPFGTGPGELPVEAGRYRLLWAPVCPWAHRSVIVRSLLGLDTVISLGTADPVRPDKPESDWAFTLDKGGLDPVLHAAYISDVYLKTNPQYKGRFTVPVVVDLQTGTVVNNDYFNLTRWWETAWKPFHRKGSPDLYPGQLRSEIDSLNDTLFQEVNNGVYKAGFARSQGAYEKAYDTVFARLDLLEEELAGKRFLFGDYITESDVRLYVTLARFDAAYYNGFKVNRNRICDYRNLWGYARDLYQTPGFGDTTDFEAIKKHYHLCAVTGNPFRIVPKGPDVSVWNRPAEERALLSTHPDQKFLVEQ